MRRQLRPLRDCPTPPAQTGNEVRGGKPRWGDAAENRRLVGVPSAAGERKMWVEWVEVEGAGGSGAPGSG